LKGVPVWDTVASLFQNVMKIQNCRRGGHSNGKPLTGVRCEPGFHDRRNTVPQPARNIPKPLQQILLLLKVHAPAVQVAMYNTESYRLLIERPKQLVGEISEKSATDGKQHITLTTLYMAGLNSPALACVAVCPNIMATS